MRGIFGSGSSLGLPMRPITPAQPIPMPGMGQGGGEEQTKGSEMMGLLGQLAGMGGQMGLFGQGGMGLLGSPASPLGAALDPSKAVGAGGFGAARGMDGSVNWLPWGTTLNDYMANQGALRYGGAAGGLPVRGLGGRLGGGV